MAGLSFKGSELLGGSIRQELDALWAEMRRLQPVPGAGQRAEYGPHGVRFTMEDGPPPCDVCDRPGACCILGVCAQLKNGDCLSAGGTWTECARCEPNPCAAPPPPPPPATGACCGPLGCQQDAEANCTAPYTFYGVGTDCAAVACGVCCDWTAADTATATTFNTSADCAAPRHWTDIAAMLSSESAACSPCCVGSDCSQRSAPDCEAAGGTVHQGPLIGGCADVTCPILGSCCLRDGTCTRTEQSACVAVDSIWTSGGVCSPNTCEIRGACCDAAGACTVETEAACTAADGTYQGADTVCDPNPCSVPPPPATGSCCYGFACSPSVYEYVCFQLSGTWTQGGSCTPNICAGACCANATGACTETVFADCGNLIAMTWTQGGSCTPNPCAQPPPATGSCCPIPGPFEGTCAQTTAADCAAGIWGMGGSCTPNPCVATPPPTGSCCAADGTCSETTQAACSGTWLSGGGCTPNICAPPTGSCCAADGTCSETTQAACSGTWSSGGTCSPDPCGTPPPATGSCCYSTTSSAGGLYCQETTAADCVVGPVRLTAAWTPGGVCFPSPCVDPMGTCCDKNTGACQDTTGPNCPTNTGTWTLGQTCAANPCTVPPGMGACCAGGTGYGCDVTTEAACGSSNWQAGLFCAPDPCVTGSCCDGAGNCIDTTASHCAAGSTWSSGGNCTPNICAQPATGSCCVPFTGCQIATESPCTIQGGTWTSGGSCTPDPCGGGGSTGACCFFGGTPCQALSSGDCMIFGGMYQGNGTTCAGAGC